jgi:hypothetical protein
MQKSQLSKRQIDKATCGSDVTSNFRNTLDAISHGATESQWRRSRKDSFLYWQPVSCEQNLHEDRPVTAADDRDRIVQKSAISGPPIQ